MSYIGFNKKKKIVLFLLATSTTSTVTVDPFASFFRKPKETSLSERLNFKLSRNPEMPAQNSLLGGLDIIFSVLLFVFPGMQKWKRIADRRNRLQ